MNTLEEVTKDSLLTTSSGYKNYRGILNLVIILLLLSNSRVALENIIKYGILVDPLSLVVFLCEHSKHWPAVLAGCFLIGHISISFALEFIIKTIWLQTNPKTSHNSNINNNNTTSTYRHNHNLSNSNKNSTSKQLVLALCKLAIVANLLACITLPPLYLYSRQTNPISASCSLMLSSIVFLKLVSYHMVLFWCRDLNLPESRQSCTTRGFLRSYTPACVEFTGRKALDLLRPEGKPSLDGSDVISSSSDHQWSSGEQPTNATVKLRQRALDQHQQQVTRRQVGGEATPIEVPSRSSSTSADTNNNVSIKTHGRHSGDYTRPHGLTREQVRQVALKVLAMYPKNVTLSDCWLFMAYPTLCYEVQFARTSRIRKRFLLKRFVELIALSQLDLALVQQWIVPTVSNSLIPFRQMQVSHMLERLLKLAIPNHVIWLIWFYLFFHSLLNIQAELFRFADREFYRDWWNSESVHYFWSNWNIPVHKWCVRHLYLPLISMGLSSSGASVAVFFVSAFFHEYLVSVPLKMFRMWAFMGMLMQLPYARFVSTYFNNNLANVAVWLSLILGQPLCILMYYHDYYVINHGVGNL